MELGTVIQGSNPGDRVVVKIGDREISLIAGNQIIGGAVFISEDMAWSTDAMSIVLQQREIFATVPEEDAEIEVILLPFQVLFFTPISLGGDRAQLNLAAATGTVGGINNLGDREYLAVWLDSVITIDSNGSITLLAIPAGRIPTDYRWLGYGKLTTNLIRIEPTASLTVSETGTFLPADALSSFTISELVTPWDDYFIDFVTSPTSRRISDYPRFNTPNFNSSSGTYEAEQFETNYTFQDLQNWDYSNTFSGNTNTPTPSPFDINSLCNATVAGAFETRDYNRSSSLQYQQQLSKVNNLDNQIYWNNELFEGDRNENYNSDFSIVRTESLFTSLSNFFCANQGSPSFPFYTWEGSNTFASWSGETTTITHQINHTISETFDRPFILGATLTHSYNLTENTLETTIYEVPAETWNTPSGFFFGFQFPVDGTETYSLNRTPLQNPYYYLAMAIKVSINRAIAI